MLTILKEPWLIESRLGEEYMAEEIKDIKKVEEVQDASVETKRFTINVDSGMGEADDKQLFSFSGPEKASLGLIYDAIHRIMMEVISIIQKRGEDLKPKKESIPEDVKSEDAADKKEK